MPKYTDIHISETIEELEKRRKKVTSHKFKTRILSLILTKERKFRSRDDLAAYLGVSLSCLKNWTNTYVKHGLEELLTFKTKGHRRNVITAEIQKALSAKVHDSENPFLGYKDAQQWVKKEYGLHIEYNTLRTHLIRHFKTKLKSPRKSHYKKDEQAIEAFKKTPKDL